MDILIELLPHIVTVTIAAGVAFARTTDTALDDKLFKLAQDNKSGIITAIKSLIDKDPEVRDAVKRAAKESENR